MAILSRPEMTRGTTAIEWSPLRSQGWHGYPTGSRAEAVITYIRSRDLWHCLVNHGDLELNTWAAY